MSAQIIMLSGIPGSGKSTLARKMIKEDPEGAVIISRDSIREMLGVYWIPSREFLVTQIEELSTKAALEQDYKVIVDATNLNKKTVSRFQKIAEEYKSRFHIIHCPISLNRAIWRDFWRGVFGGKRVGSEVIKAFHRKYEASKV